MKITEVTKLTKTAILESLKEDKEHTFSDVTLEEIAESVANFNESATAMTTEEALNLLRAGGH